MVSREQCQYSKALDKLKTKECAKCNGAGYIDDIDPKDMFYNVWECSECIGTGYGIILPRPDADKALKEMIKTLTPAFMKDKALNEVEKFFLVIPASEVIFRDYEKGILILNLFNDIVICIKQDGFAWIEYENP